MFKTIKLIVLATLCLNFSSNAQQPRQQKSAIAKTDTIKGKKDTINLNEIQIIGYGQTTKRLHTGSISSITVKEIENQPVTNILSALSGRMPGVFVQTTNSLPGGNINIQIRGKGSLLAGTNPLYIIDGMPYNGNAINSGNSLNTNNIAGTLSPLNNINPSDIASITILKDADATSIYGSRGSNGVVLIRTKKGTTGATKLDVNVQQGISQLAARPDLLSASEYLDLRKEAFANDNKIPSPDPTSPNYAPDLTVWDQQANTDWVKYLYGNTANFSNLQARLSGGKGNISYSISGSYRNEGTLLPGYNNYFRAGLSSQFQYTSDDGKLMVSVSNQFSNQFNDFSNLVTTVQTSFLKAPNYPLYLPDGSLNAYGGPNILAEVSARSKTKTDNSITNLNLRYALLEGLKFNLNTAYNKTTYDQTMIFPSRSLFPGTLNYTNLGNNASQSLIIEPQLDYLLKLKSSSIAFLAGGTLQNLNNTAIILTANNFSLESLMENLGSGTISNRSSNSTKYKYASVFGRTTFTLKDSYVFNATIRRDGSSRFGPGNRYGTFGAVGVAWIFSDLAIFKEKTAFLSHGKLRASYGTTGNDQIGDYAFLSTYYSSGFNYQDVGTLLPLRVNNENFHWESTRKTDLGFLANRILLTTDYYFNKSNNQLVQYTLPTMTGFTGYQANLPAEIINQGWEFSLSAKLLDKGFFSWSCNANLTLPQNQLKSFENFQSSSYATTYEIGYDITRIKGYKYLGTDPATGNPRYAGQDGTASATPYSNFTLGKLTPDYYGGFGSIFSYQNVELSVFAQFVKQVSKGGLLSSSGSGVINTFGLVRNRWSMDNPNADLPKATTVSDPYFATSSINIFDTSLIRIKNISLSYQLPGRFCQKLNLKNVKLYTEAQNVMTFWNRKAAVMDPESGPIVSGQSRNIPLTQTFVFGLQFNL